MRPNADLTHDIPILFSAQTGQVSFGAENPFFSAEIPFVRGVKEFTAAYMNLWTRQHKTKEQGISDQDRRKLRALRLLQYVHSSGSAEAARELGDALEVLGGAGVVERLGLSNVPKVELAANWYAGSFNFEMKKARIVMWQRNKNETPIPAVWCPDIRTAAFVFAAFRGITVCPGCRQLFAPNPQHPAKYCSEKCGQRIWQREYRVREKKKLRPAKRKGRL
jgi:hypothetical protein